MFSSDCPDCAGLSGDIIRFLCCIDILPSLQVTQPTVGREVVAVLVLSQSVKHFNPLRPAGGGGEVNMTIIIYLETRVFIQLR